MGKSVWLGWSCLAILVAACPGGGRSRSGAPAKRTLTVLGGGPGAVISEPSGIYCGDVCTAAFNRGAVVTLVAKSKESVLFTGWQGPCTGRALCMVSMDRDQTVTATWAIGKRTPPEEIPPDPDGGPRGDPDREEDGSAGDDRDGDGISDALDSCADDPEDVDGFEDADGCPDLDNDADGIADVDDLCPSAAEDRDGFEEEDGCPDPDNDQDGIVDFDDRCPNQPETMNGFDDYDGCPDRIR